MIDLLGQITEKAYCFRRIDAVESKYLYNSTSGKDFKCFGAREREKERALQYLNRIINLFAFFSFIIRN